MPPKSVKKALKVEEFLPSDDILETSSRWKSWRRKIELQMDYFEITDPKDKTMCLLVHGGEHILSIDENSPETDDKDADEYAVLIQKIEKIYIPKKSRLHARYRFNKARKEAGQTIAQYEIELRRLAKDCEFHGYDDEMILDRLLSTCEDEKLQDEALSKDWDLKTFMKHATTKQDIKAQTEDMKSEIKNEASSEYIRATYTGKPRTKSSKQKIYSLKKTKNPTWKNTRVTETPAECQKKCQRCGYDQSHETCPAIGKQCNLCGKANHFRSCCRTRPKDCPKSRKFQKSVIKDDTSDSDVDIDVQGARLKLNVRKVKAGKDAGNILLPVKICGVELDIDPDTGADVDLISKDDFQKIYQQRPDVEKLISVPKEAIRALGGAKLGIICVLKDATLSNKTVKNIVRDIYVTENGIHNHPLLSEKTLLDLGMVQYSADGEFAEQSVKKIDKVDSDKSMQDSSEKTGIAQMEKIVSTYKKLFEGIGRFKDPYNGEPILTHIQMKPEAEPVIQPPRVIPHHLRERTKNKLNYFVKEGIMSWTDPGEPIVYASPLVITPKSSGPDADVRITADFRLANKGASRTRIVPGVKTEDLAVIFAGCKIFSKIDLNNGYHQFAIDEESKKYLVVTTPWGNLKHNTLAQGWITSQDEFDRRMSEILAGIPRVKNNRDDCLIGGRDWKEHNRNLNEVLSRLQSFGLTINREKCEFGKYEIEFYGHRFTQNGLKPSREKVKALKECGEPTTKEGVRSFLQMVGYMSRFIPNFSQIAAPLRALTKHKVQFKWEEEEQVAFRRLKESLKEETSLAYFVPNQPIRVHVDAGKKMESTSNVPGGLCAILTQQDENGVWRMCNVANRTLTDIETRYGQTELEALAIKWACSDAFYQFLVGASKFEILTDCKPLVHLFNNPKSRAPIRIERQILAIQGLEYTVVYNRGKDNIADYGSRHIIKNELIDQVSNESFEEEIVGLLFEPDSESDRIIMERANEDEHYQVLKDVVENDLWKSHKNNPKISQFYGVASDLSVVKGLVFYKDLLVPPFVMYNAFIDEAHKIGHSGEKRTVDLLRERIWFPGMTKLAKDVVKSCLSC